LPCQTPFNPKKMHRISLFRWVFALLMVLLAVVPPAVAFDDPNIALPQSSLPAAVESGLNHLLDFCAAEKDSQPKDFAPIDPVIDFVLKSKSMADATPAERDNAQGSFVAYQIKRPMTQVIRYAYNNQIPEGAINPSSVNYSIWKEVDGGKGRLPKMWQRLGDLSTPMVSRGVVHEAISPDLHTGAYYEYDLQRAFLIYRRGSLRVFISLSRQLGDSEVGKKGFIVGDDKEWNYLYSQEQGIDKAGLGWVKSKIYNYLSVCFFIGDDAHPDRVNVGAFQWLKAGWIGLNMVNSHHIRKGMERYAYQFKAMMEAPQLPQPAALEKVYDTLAQTDIALLRQKTLDVTRYILAKARQDSDLSKKEAIQTLDEKAYVAGLDKGQLITTMMREYIKFCLGKETPLHAFWVALKENAEQRAYPLS